MKNFNYFLITYLLISCSNSGDNFIGQWESSNGYIEIKKAGNGFLLMEYVNNHNNNAMLEVREYDFDEKSIEELNLLSKGFAEFEDGCFKVSKNGNKNVVLCDDGNGDLIAIHYGETLKKM